MARKQRFASLTSAASRIFNPESSRPPSTPTSTETLYDLYTNLGQIRAALEFKAMAASKVTYYPATKEGPKDDPEPVEDGPAREAFDALEGVQGEFGDFVAEFCSHMDIAGEGYLVGWGGNAENPEPNRVSDEWDVISPVEYKRARSEAYQMPDAAAIKRITDSDFVLRVWRPHPKMRELPNSALRSVQVECEQYILLRGMISSVAQSRLIMGILGVPEGLSFPPKANGDPADEFFDVFMEAAEAVVRNPDSAARVVPIMVQGDGEILQQFNFIDMSRELPEWVPTLMERVLRQIATGLDLPADILLGLADVNHWTAWLSEDSAKLDYVDPLVLLVLDSLSRGYLRPYLRAAGVQNADQYLFWRDYSDLIARSVGTEDAVALFDRNIISDEAVRRVVGFTEADASELEPVEAEVIDFPESERGIPETPIPGRLIAAGSPSLGQIDHRLFTQIAEASQAALDRALERAGQKIRSHAVGDPRRPAKHPQLAAAIEGVSNMSVGQTLGAGVKETLQLTDDDLIPEGTFSNLEKRARTILERGQDETAGAVAQVTGSEPQRNEEEESGWIRDALTALIAGVTALALRRLFTPEITPDPAETGEIADTQIPSALVWESLTLAGGSVPSSEAGAPRGLANGAQTQQWFTVAGYEIRERVWTVGAPAMPFEPHQNLRGQRFTQWTDAALATPLSAQWLGVSYMFPGDHRGCQCVAELVVSENADLLSPLAANG